MFRLISTIVSLFALAFAALHPQAEATTPEPPAIERPAPIISEIGGTPVPYGLDCEEDETIYFTGPDTLDCVHIDVLAGEG